MTRYYLTFSLACLILLATSGVGIAGLGDCSQPVTTGATPTAADCLFILKTAVGSQTCDPVCVCDVNGESGVTAADALICLKKAVGQDIALTCPTPCGGPVTTSTSTTSSSTSSSTSTITVPTTTVPVGGQQASSADEAESADNAAAPPWSMTMRAATKSKHAPALAGAIPAAAMTFDVPMCALQL